MEYQNEMLRCYWIDTVCTISASVDLLGHVNIRTYSLLTIMTHCRQNIRKIVLYVLLYEYLHTYVQVLLHVMYVCTYIIYVCMYVHYSNTCKLTFLSTVLSAVS